MTTRKGEDISAAALQDYLRRHFDQAAGNITIEQFPNGHSNLTYLVKIDGREYVLRRAPLGPLPAKAHDMAREYRVLQAISPYFPEAPRVFHLCEDPSVIGAVFLLMERRRGIILRDRIPPEVNAIADHPRLISEAFVDCMLRLHSIEIDQPLSELGRPDGYLDRQVRGWADRWSRAKTQDNLEMDRVIGWLAKNLPRSPAPTLVHNDYKLDNVVLAAPSPDQIEAVLDWEMATVGDPLSDLGVTLAYWAWANAPEVRAAAIPAFTLEPGWFTRDEFVERYARLTARDVSGIGYYEVLGVFKIAVIIQQIYFRFHQGQTNDERFRNFGVRVQGLARLAASLMERHG